MWSVVIGLPGLRADRLKEFGAGADAQFLVDAGKVGFHRFDRHKQCLGGLAVGEARRGQLGDAALGGGQRVGAGDRRAARARPERAQMVAGRFDGGSAPRLSASWRPSRSASLGGRGGGPVRREAVPSSTRAWARSRADGLAASTSAASASRRRRSSASAKAAWVRRARPMARGTPDRRAEQAARSPAVWPGRPRRARGRPGRRPLPGDETRVSMPKSEAEQITRRLRVVQRLGRPAFGECEPGPCEQGDGEVHRAGWRFLVSASASRAAGRSPRSSWIVDAEAA